MVFFRFGFSTPVDLLSWIVVVTLGAKLLATIVVVIAGKHVVDRPGWGSILWWVTKLTPIIAIPCAIAVAVMQKQDDAIIAFVAMTLFVIIAVPLKIRQRGRRIARRQIRGEAL